MTLLVSLSRGLNFLCQKFVADNRFCHLLCGVKFALLKENKNMSYHCDSVTKLS